MITAMEAFRNTVEETQEYQIIEGQIYNAISEGEFKIEINRILSVPAAALLTHCKFDIQVHIQSDENITTIISWKDGYKKC